MLRLPDYLIIVAYFALMIIIGYLFRKFARDARTT
jgi:Na+/proline symporter